MGAGTGSDTVFIGLPCYNRPDGLRRAIACMQAQTHGDWRMLIADNASPDLRVGEIGHAAASADPRIAYIRQETNIGAAGNFRFVANRADAPFFMWASDDDVWEPDFIATLLALLKADPQHQMAFSSIDNINRDGLSYRSYPGFTRLNSGDSRLEDARRFLDDPEIMGKANLIYGIFRTDALKAAVDDYWEIADLGAHGGDVVFLFGFVARHPVIGTDAVLLHKRVPTTKTAYRLKHPPRGYFVRLRQYRGYLNRHLAVSPDEKIRIMARETLRKRLIDKYLCRMMPNRFGGRHAKATGQT